MATSDEMGAYSHDQIQHPLLWCDEKKRLVERKNAEESLRMWRRRKAEECARKEKDKQEYYDLFLQHYPWGRPGGGAPNVEVRRKDITAVGLHSTPTDTSAHRASLLHPFQYNDYFSVQKSCLKNPLSTCSHHQHPPAPDGRLTHSTHHLQESGLRSSTVTICEREHPFKKGVVQAYRKNSDSLHIDLKEHPSMSNRNKGQVDIELRFIPPPPCKVKPVLEKVVLKSETEHPVQEKFGCQKKKLQANCEKPLLKEPWGKAGPGGKPWRSPKEVGSTFMKSMGWTNKEMLKDLDQDNPVTPAEKNTFSNLNCGKPIKLQCCGEACTCSCPVLNSSSLLKPSKRITAVVLPASECGKRSSLKECKPLKVCPRKQRSHFTSSTGNSTATPDAVLESEGGGVELVPLLARRRGLHCPISLSSTDVTKRKPSHDRIQTVTYMRYLHDLNLQISQKRHSSCVARQMDRELCNQHFNTFETFWGRPGHGAPSGYKINKLRLDELLYGTASEKQ